MKKLSILFLILVIPVAMVLVSCGNKQDKCSEGFTYELSLDMNSYAITGIGDCTDKDIIFPSSYNGLPITEIKENAFKNNTGIQSITISNSITTIGKNAFSNCSNLKTIDIKGAKTYINSFDNCINIEVVKIDTIQNWCFSTFSSSAANPLTGGAKLLENNKEVNTLTIGSSIGNYAFYNYKYLTEVNFTNNNAQIGLSAFENNEALKNVCFAGKVTAGHSAFNNCTNIEKVVTNDLALWTQSEFETEKSNPTYYSHNLYLGNNEVKEIDIETNYLSRYLFINCEAIEDVNILVNMRQIGADAFYGCTSIKNIKINSIENWLSVKLYNAHSNPAYYADNVYINNVLVTELTLPESITEVNSYQFFGWKNVEKVFVPQTVTKIGLGAFGGCNNIKEITVPFIGEYAYNNYPSMTEKAKCFHLGYIFGDIEYDNSYHESGYDIYYYVNYSFYIPLSLEKIYLAEGEYVDSDTASDYRSEESDKANYKLYIKKS